jgi:hypothetical protein
LNIKIKSYKEIKEKTENRKIKRRKGKKYEKGLGEAFRPSASFGHSPFGGNPEPVPLSPPSPAGNSAPPVS